MGASCSRARRGMDRRAHLLERAATADVADVGVDVGVGRLGLVLEQRRHRHDHAALAIAALRHVVLEPRLLHLVQRAVLREPFDGGDLLTVDRAERHRARTHRDAVDVDGAGAALGDAATVFGTRQPDRLPQHPEQRSVGVDVDLMSRSIDAESSHMQSSREPPCGRRCSTRRQPLGCAACAVLKPAYFNSNMEFAPRRDRIAGAGERLPTRRRPGKLGSFNGLGARRRPPMAAQSETARPRMRSRRSCPAMRRPWAAALRRYANEMLWFFNGKERMRLPVAAKNALSTAGAATKMVGSPTPPQKPPDGTIVTSTFGISLMRIEL